MISGGAVAAAAFLLARYGPSGDDWSFRGNGALAAYALVPAFLAGGIAAVAMRYRRGSWLITGIGAFAVGAALAVIDALLLPVFGRGADQAAGPVVLVTLAAWAVIAPVAALWLPRRSRTADGAVAGYIAAALLWAAGLVAGLVGVGFVVPAGS